MAKNKVIPVEKRSKKEQAAFNSLSRVTTGWNTGTRTMKTAKYPSRQQSKLETARSW